MKIESAPQDVVVHGDFPTSDFNVGDISFIVDMFADKVYSHKERAVIRELACNAHDSHVIAGTTDIPFDVHLPTQLEAYFSLRDYGTGLSDQEVRNVFAGIGISTKRDSNEVIGCFGIGGLSPYSLCDSFTVKSYHDGTLRHYSCYRDKDRKPVVALLSESDTTEHNGLEVSVSVEDRVYEFEKEATYVFKFWEGTLPNINNNHVVEQCKSQRNEYVFKGDDFGMTSSWGSMYAIMGNIAYKIPDELDEFDCNGYLKFNLGELNFDTARENLSMDDKTKEAIKKKTKSVKEKLSATAIDQIEQEPTDFKKAQLADKLRCGQIGRHIKANLDKYHLPEPTNSVTYWQSKYRGSEKYNTKHVPVGDDTEYYLYKDRMQTRIKSYLKDTGSGCTMVIFSNMEQFNECKIDPEVLLDLEDLPKVTRQSYSSAGSKVKTFVFDNSGNHYHDSDYWDRAELEIDGKEIVYVEINRWKPQHGHQLISEYNGAIRSTISSLGDVGIDVPVVVGLKSVFLKTAAFRKGNFIHLDDYVKRELAIIAPSTYYKYSSNDFCMIKKIAGFIEHESINKIIDLENNNKNNKVSKMCKRVGVDVNIKEDTFLQECMDGFFQKFEMLSLLNEWEISSNKEKVSRYIGGIVK